jgi:2'-5' RNA ligase
VTQPSTLSPRDEDWRRFRQVTSMVDHWDRPNWTPNKQAYYWYLTFDSAELRQLAGYCQDRLRLPYLDPVPLDGLHLTLPKVGWSDEMSFDDVDAVTAVAMRSCADLRPFTLTVGPLAGSNGAVRFSVSPWEPVVALHRRLQGAVRTVRGISGKEAEFRPHVGIAYCNSTITAEDLIAAVEPLRNLPPVEVAVSRVELVLLRREDHTYKWSTAHSLALD